LLGQHLGQLQEREDRRFLPLRNDGLGLRAGQIRSQWNSVRRHPIGIPANVQQRLSYTPFAISQRRTGFG
jgi:hypothetical protein